MQELKIGMAAAILFFLLWANEQLKRGMGSNLSKSSKIKYYFLVGKGEFW